MNYYVSKTTGSNTNSGTSISSPWATISKVNSQSLSPGDAVYFRCGDEWREQLNLTYSGNISNYITFSSYGTGNKPIINGAELMSGWTNAGSNQWWIVNPNVTTTQAMVVIGGVIFSEVSSQANVNSAAKYFVDTVASPKRIYVYSTVDPATLGSEISNRNYCIYGAPGSLIHHVLIKDIECRFSGRSGIEFWSNSSDLDGSCIVDNCLLYANRIHGGCSNDKHNNDIYRNCFASYNGNGFYAWESSSGIQCINCKTLNNINYIIGAGQTDGHGYGSYKGNNWVVDSCWSDGDADAIHIDASSTACNATIRYNRVFRSNNGVGGPPTPGIGFGSLAAGATINIYYNLLVNCGSAGIETYTTQAGTVNLYNNTIVNDVNTAQSASIYIAGSGANIVAKNNLVVRYYVAGKHTLINGSATMATLNYNCYFIVNQVSGLLRNHRNGTSYNDIAAWRTGSSQDANSIAADPLFMNIASDWSLKSTSPCRAAGTNVGLTRDILGNPVSGTPDIGCFQYRPPVRNKSRVRMGVSVGM